MRCNNNVDYGEENSLSQKCHHAFSAKLVGLGVVQSPYAGTAKKLNRLGKLTRNCWWKLRCQSIRKSGL
jgi:hypothetical protein